MESEQHANFLKPLENILPVDAPPFLFTRIQQRIENQLAERLSKPKAWAMVASFCVLVMLNIVGISQLKSPATKQKDLVQQLRLMPDNNLYR